MTTKRWSFLLPCLVVALGFLGCSTDTGGEVKATSGEQNIHQMELVSFAEWNSQFYTETESSTGVHVARLVLPNEEAVSMVRHPDPRDPETLAWMERANAFTGYKATTTAGGLIEVTDGVETIYLDSDGQDGFTAASSEQGSALDSARVIEIPGYGRAITVNGAMVPVSE